MKLTAILENVIRKSGGLKPPTLGKTEMLSISNDDKKQLLSDLRKESGFLNKIIIAIIVLHFLLFALAFFLVLYYKDSPNTILLLLGGSVLSLMGIIASMTKLLKTKNTMDLIRVTLPNLSPEQAMIVIQNIYNNDKKQDQ